MFLGPQRFLERGVALSGVITGALAAIDDAGRDMGISAGLLVIAQRHRNVDDALDLLRAIEPWADRIAGVGLGGAERANPPTKFARFFGEARRRGFRLTAHAGEEGPASWPRASASA
jgi:adenosine deaminase